MISSFANRVTFWMAGALLFTACQSPPKPPPPPGPSRAELQKELAESRKLVSRYEQRYGSLLPKRPSHDFRKLRTQLKGKPMSAVTAMLGKPAKVFTSGSSESWDYANAAYDSVSGSTVRKLEIWFRNGVVEYMNASF
jgi:hypothetical protein